MKTHVVCYDSKYLTNFRHLPVSFELSNGDRVLTHTDPNYEMVGDHAVANFDLYVKSNLVTPDYTRVLFEDVFPKQVVVLKRLPKSLQALHLNNFSGVGQQKVRTYKYHSAITTADSYTFGSQFAGKVVIKPEDGARGMAHWILDSDRILVGSFLTKLRTGTDIPELLEKFKPYLEFHTGKEYRENEAKEIFDINDVVVQEVIQGIANEYRILTDKNGDIAFVGRRTRRSSMLVQTASVDQTDEVQKTDDAPYLQATGSEGYLYNPDDIIFLSEFPKIFSSAQQHKSFVKLCRELIGPMNSVDLFITENGTWGVFEYCSQFGTVAVPADIARRLHIDYIESLLLK